MKKFYPFFFLAFLLGNVQLSAQVINPATGQPFVRCYTVENEALRKADNPHIPETDEFEEWLQPLVTEYKKEASRNPNTKNQIITIPIVVHILHGGEPEGTYPNIWSEQALSQVQVLNEDFRRITGSRGESSYGDDISADVGLEFCLAKVDPDGNPTSGINHVDIGQSSVTRDDLENTFKPQTIWDPNKYMNMWAVQFAAPDDNLLGYAQFPESSGLAGMPSGEQGADTDGVVMRAEAFGTIDADTDPNKPFQILANYAYGRTATHEVGHWVGLRHTWGDALGCNMGVIPDLGISVPAGCSCMVDDYCEDTPNHAEANYSCDNRKSTCGNGGDMYENYMDYTRDNCMNTFTQDQKARVITVMQNSPRRKELLTSTTCFDPAPFIFFDNPFQSGVEGSGCGTFHDVDIPVNIQQAPTGDVTVDIALAGDASEGDNADYKLMTPTLTFLDGATDPQMVTVRIYEDESIEEDETIELALTNVNGGDGVLADFKTTATFTIIEDDLAPELKGTVADQTFFTEAFSDDNHGWLSGGFGNVSWHRGTAVASGGSMMFVGTTVIGNGVYAYTGAGEARAELESPAIDASTFSNIRVTFDYAVGGEEDGSDIYDFGSLHYSTDGTTWKNVGPALVGQSTGVAVITSSETVELPADANTASTLYLKFQWDNDALIDMDPPLSIDNVTLVGDQLSPTPVATTLALNDEVYLGPYYKVPFYDATGNVIALIEELSGLDYGCTVVSIEEEGSTATNLSGDSEEVTKLASKKYNVAPTTNHANGQYKITFYLTDAEKTGWEGTDRTWANAGVVKNTNAIADANSISELEGKAGTTAIYNATDHSITAEFTSGFSSFAIADQSAFGNTNIAVELAAFTGFRKGQTVELNWITANEINNAYFEVERAQDGLRFNQLSQIAAAGNSSKAISYQYTDTKPVNGLNYYRLKEVDVNGAVTYSNTIVVDMKATEFVNAIYPVPASNNLYVALNSKVVDSQVQVQLRNMLGQVIYTTVEQASDRIQINTSTVPDGIYLVEVKKGNIIDSRKVVIRH